MNGRFSRSKRYWMFPYLWINGTELEMVEPKQQFFMNKSTILFQLFFVFLRVLQRLKIKTNIINNGLKIIGRFLQIPQLLINTRLIMQSDHNNGPINSLPTASRILQYFLTLTKIYNSLFMFLIFYTLYSFCI